MNTFIKIAACATAFLIFTVSDTRARTVPCASHGDVAKHLRQGSKDVVWRGRDKNDNLVEIYADADGAWTLVVTRPDGVACLVSGGEDSRQIDPEILGPTASL